MKKTTRRTRRRDTREAGEDVPVYGPEYADDAATEDFEENDGSHDDFQEPEYAGVSDDSDSSDSYEDSDAEQAWADNDVSAKRPLSRPEISKPHRFVEPRLYHSSPVHRYDDDSPNPTPSRRWPLYAAMTLTALLVFAAINVEQGRQDSEHWAAPDATGINDPLVPQEIMAPSKELPTRVPLDYLEKQVAAFAENQEELVTATPFVTEAPVVFTPSPTAMPLLKKGMQGDFVKDVQLHLVRLNYLDDEQADGKYEASTVKAVKEFQQNNYLLPPDGMVGKQTYDEFLNPNAVANPTPAPRLNEPYVWATLNGNYYHSRSGCSNMKHAIEYPISEAKSMKKTPCPKCNPPK